jgi:hypothetical protein
LLLESDPFLLLPALFGESLLFLSLELLPIHPFCFLPDSHVLPLCSFEEVSMSRLGVPVVGEDFFED